MADITDSQEVLSDLISASNDLHEGDWEGDVEDEVDSDSLSTPRHNIPVPTEGEGFLYSYKALLQMVDAGIIVVADDVSQLDSYGGAPENTLGVVADGDDVSMYVGDSGGFDTDDEIELGGGVEDVLEELNEEFADNEGDLNLNGQNIQDAGTVDANAVEADEMAPDKLILPDSF